MIEGSPRAKPPARIYFIAISNLPPRSLLAFAFCSPSSHPACSSPFTSSSPSSSMSSASNAYPQYTPVTDDEKESRRNTNDEGCSETDLFLPVEILPNQLRTAFQQQHWRIGLEVLLLLCSLAALAGALFYKPPLLKRQQECGELLGQWRTSPPFPWRHREKWILR